MVSSAGMAQQIEFYNNDFNAAQLKFLLTQETARQIVTSERCVNGLKEKYGSVPFSEVDPILIPANIVDDLHYRDSLDNPVLWKDKLGEMANTVCFRTKGGENFGFINIPIDTVLTSDYPLMTYVWVHEILHYTQCLSGNVWGKPMFKVEKEIRNLMTESCYP